MKKIALILSVLLMSFTSQAQTGFYFKAAAGPSWQSSTEFSGVDVTFDPRFIGTIILSAGVQLNPFFATEAELSTRSVNIDTLNGSPEFGDLDTSALMFNAVGRLPITQELYFTYGGGLGFLTTELYDPVFDDFVDGSSFASQFMVGFEMEFADNVNFFVEYKQISDFNLELSGFDESGDPFQDDFSFSNGTLLIGGKVTFN